MRQPPAGQPGAGRPVVVAAGAGRPVVVAAGAGRPGVVAAAAARLAEPGLVVLAGPPGIGRTAALRQLTATFRGPVYLGGGLAMLQAVPALALTRAVRVRLPTHDAALLAEAVRSRVRGGLLVLDDLQWADPVTVAALPTIAVHCRVAVAVRTPNRIPVAALATLRADSTWFTVPPLTPDEADAAVRRLIPAASAARVADIVQRAGGVPLAVVALSRLASAQLSSGDPSSVRPGVIQASPTRRTGVSAAGFGVAAGTSGPPAATAGAGAVATAGAGALADAGAGALADAGAGAVTPGAGPGAIDRATGLGSAGPAADPLAYPVAAAIADLTRSARTAMAALGLLGRPAPAAILGDGVAELRTAGLVEIVHDNVTAASGYVAEVAAGLLSAPARRALHRRLADLVPAREAVRHLAAAGEAELAYRTAVRAADAAAGTTDRAELLLLACDLAGHRAEETVRLAAASAALHAGRPGACLRVLEADVLTADPTAGPEHWPGRHGRAAAVLRAEALVQTGAPAAAVAAISAISDTEPADTEPADTGSADTGSAGGGSAGGDRAGGGWPADLLGARDRVLLLGALANGPDAAVAVLGPILARHGDTPAHAGLRAAIAAVRAATRQAGWEYGLASAAAAAGGADDVLAARWSAWLLVETLAADGRLAAAGVAATAAGHACAADLAYSWQTRFVAAALWYTALRGDQVADQTTDENPNGPNNGDTVVRRATDLTDRTVPAIARGYAAAAASLVEADSGLLASARSRLAAVGAQPAATAAVLDWVRREAAWLDGQPDLSTATVAVLSPGPPAGPAAAETDAASSTLIGGLLHITARWARYDTDAGHVPGSRLPSPNVGADVVGSELPGPDIRGRDTGDHGAGRPDPGDRGSDPHIGDPAHPARIPAVAATLRAWAAVDQPALFDGAGAAWHTVARREEIRCLLAHGLLDPEPTGAVPPLLRAERLAGDAGLVVLLGRVRRALRRHAIHRDTRGRRTTGEELTDRERDVLGLVAHGEPTRRIAARLGIARETVETHIRAGMRKLGARTRTEAAALALEELA